MEYFLFNKSLKMMNWREGKLNTKEKLVKWLKIK